MGDVRRVNGEYSLNAPLSPSPELLIVLARMEVERERKGADWCRKHGIGRVRETLGRALPPDITVLQAFKSPEIAARIEAQRTAQDLMAAVCAACGGCVLARR